MYKLNDAEMFYDITDGQAVVINFATGAYYGPNPLGSAVLDRLLKGYAPERILAALKKAPGCPEDMEKQIQEFIAKLENFRILEKGETTEGGDADFDGALYEPGFALQIMEYKEVQDLILADPVHEVEEEMGWPALKDDAKKK